MNKFILRQIVKDAWNTGILVLAVLVFFEILQKGFVSRFFNMNWMVLILFALSILLLATNRSDKKEAKIGYMLLQIVGVVAAVAVWIFLPEGMRVFWKAAAAGGILLAALLAAPLLKKE